MGIYLDTVEDNDELIGQRIEASQPSNSVFRKVSESVVKCPCCGVTKKCLNDHIFSQHRHDHTSNTTNQNCSLPNQNLRLKNLINIENEIFNLQKLIDKNDKQIHSLFSNYSLQLNDSSMQYDSTQKQYLRGCLEYLRAHHLEVNEHSSDLNTLSSQFEHAYTQLKPFSTFLANQIRCAVAFKMNWFRRDHNWFLQDQGIPTSLFFLAWHFFNFNYEDVTKFDNFPIRNRRKQGIILDQFHLELLNALQFYYCNRQKLNDNRLLNKLDELVRQTENPNYVHKLQLFKARLYRDWKDFEKAKIAYHAIKTHPYFGKEASSLL